MNWLWSIFGNDDEWPPPIWFMGFDYWMARVFGRRLGWLIRNPFHNLTRYRWGLTGKDYEVCPPGADTWSKEGGWNTVGLWYGLWFHMFRSYRGKYIEFYYGWRPNDGAFGIALRRARSK